MTQFHLPSVVTQFHLLSVMTQFHLLSAMTQFLILSVLFQEVVAPPAGSGQHFDGTLAGNVKTSKADGGGGSVMTSDQLLSRMRARNSLNLGEGSAGSSEGMTPNIELITDMRNYLAFTAHVSGQATTQEIIDHFKPRVPQQTAATFRAMLRQVCDFTKTTGVGIWVLKPEYR